MIPHLMLRSLQTCSLVTKLTSEKNENPERTSEWEHWVEAESKRKKSKNEHCTLIKLFFPCSVEGIL